MSFVRASHSTRGLLFACRRACAFGLGLGLLASLGCGDDGGDPPQRTLAFVDQPPPSTEAFAAMVSDVSVEILDDEGRRVDSNTVVELRVGVDPGRLILHASGRSDIDPDPAVASRRLELVDAASGAETVLHWLEYEWGGPEATALAFDTARNRFQLATRLTLDFFDGDPATGDTTLVGVGTTDEFKGMAFETGVDPRLLGVVSRDSGLAVDGLYAIDPDSGVPRLLGRLVPDLGRINGFAGLAPDPLTGQLLAAVDLGQLGLTEPALMQVDAEALTATFLCELVPPGASTPVAGLAVTPDGALFAVTGGTPTPGTPPSASTLHRVSVPDPVALATPCGLSPVLDLGVRDIEEAVTALPTQLRGNVRVAAVGGLATFSGLQLTAVGSGFELEASAANATPALSAAFDVSEPVRTRDVQFATTSLGVVEGTGGDTIVGFDVEYAGGGNETHDVIVTISGGNGEAMNAFQPDTDLEQGRYLQLTIPAGQSGASGSITVLGDADVEPDETIVLYIEDASLAAGIVEANRTLTLTIGNDD